MTNNYVSYKVPESRKLTVKAYGNLDITGWDRPDITLDINNYTQRVEQNADGLRIVSFEDCLINIPSDVSLEIEKAFGNVRIREISGDVKIIKVNGKLAVQTLANVKIGKIDGECLVNKLTGSLLIEKVNGELKGDEILGTVSVSKCNGRVTLNRLGNSVNISSNGDIELGLLGDTHGNVNLRANGDVKLFIPPLFRMNYKLESKSEVIKISLTDQTSEMNTRRFTSGVEEFANDVNIVADGDIHITSTASMTDEVQALFENLDLVWDSLREQRVIKRKSKMDFVSFDTEAFEQEVNSKLAGVEQKIKDALSKVDFNLKNLGISTRLDDTLEVTEDQDKVTEQEKLMIIKMVQERKISVEQADKLLTALEMATE